MEPIPIFRGSSGLNTTVDPVRIGHNPETGVTDLAIAVNVVHDKTGRPSRRPGYTQLQAGAFHSLFCDGGECCIGQGNLLYLVNPDYSLTGIRSGLSGTWIDYAQVGSVIYYCNGVENGIVRDRQSFPWPEDAYAGPDTTRQFFPAPVGQHLAEYAGRMFIAQGGVLWYSEPYAYGLYDKARCFVQFHSRIILVEPVDMGLFVSDKENIWFISGSEPSKLQPFKRTSYPALEWSAAIDRIEVAKLGIDMPGMGVMFASTKGAILGLPDGQIINLTENKVNYPLLGTRGAGLIKEDNFIHSLFY